MKGFAPETSVEGGFLDAQDHVEALRRGCEVAAVVKELPEAEVLDRLQLQVVVQLVRHLEQASRLKLTLS